MRFDFYRGFQARNDWSATIIVGRLQVRIGRYQNAIWWHKGNYEFAELFNWIRPIPRELRGPGQ